MTEKTSLEKRLTDYLSDEPVMRLSLEEVVRRGRRQQRRRGWTAAFGVVVACSLVAVGAGWYADWGSDEGGTFAPAGQTRESGGPAPTPSTGADTVTGPAKMLRAVVIDYYGDATEEVRLWGATWADFSVPHDLDDPLEHQPAVPAGEESTASEWHYRFRPNASTLVQLDAGYLPPDLPEDNTALTCLPDEVLYDACTDGVFPDGTRWKQTIRVHGGDPAGGPTSYRTLTTVHEGFMVRLDEMHEADYSSDPEGADWLISADDAKSLVSEPGLVFDAPADFAPLPSYQLCYFYGAPNCLE